MRLHWVVSVLAGILFLGTLGLSQDAEAATITISDGPSCNAVGGIFHVIFFPFFQCDVSAPFVVNAGDTLVIENIVVEFFNSLTNFGIIDVNGGLGSNEGLLAIGPGGVLINECGGVINANGADGFFSGALVIISNLQNKGTINLFGDDAGPFSGSLLLEMDGVIDNHSTINETPGIADTSGTVFDLDGLTGTFNDGLPDLCS